MEKQFHELTIDEKVNKILEKYRCDCKNADNLGCTDCYNTGYTFDTEEIAVIEELNALRRISIEDEVQITHNVVFGWKDRLKILFGWNTQTIIKQKVSYLAGNKWLTVERFPYSKTELKKFSEKGKRVHYGQHYVNGEKLV